jgi:hypothetical protein
MTRLLPFLDGPDVAWGDCRRQLGELAKEGLPVRAVLPPDRPIVSLHDAMRVAADFMVRRTLPSSVDAFLALFDFEPLAQQVNLDFLRMERRAIIVTVPSRQTNTGVLAIYDAQARKRLELEIGLQEGFATRRGVEYPRAGLRALLNRSVWHVPSLPPC